MTEKHAVSRSPAGSWDGEEPTLRPWACAPAPRHRADPEWRCRGGSSGFWLRKATPTQPLRSPPPGDPTTPHTAVLVPARWVYTRSWLRGQLRYPKALHTQCAHTAPAHTWGSAGVHAQLSRAHPAHVHTRREQTRLHQLCHQRPRPQPLLGRNVKVGVGRSAQILGLRERPPSPDEASEPSVGTCPQRRGNCPRGGPGACLHPRAGRLASLGSGKAPVPSVSTDPDWAPVLCAGPSTRCAHLPCHVLGTWTEGPSPCAASSTAGTESPLWAGDPRRAERPGA